jgi:type I restriction enzyme R subunit
MYISADPSKKISALDDLSLIELVVQRGEAAVQELPESIQKDKEAVAETIEHNLRKVIIEERPTNPKYYEKMSELLDELIQQRKKAAMEYQAYLKKLVELTRKVKKMEGQDYPKTLTSSAQKALYDNLNNDFGLALTIDETVRYTAKDGWRGNKFKEREVKQAIQRELPEVIKVGEILDVIKNQDEY